MPRKAADGQSAWVTQMRDSDEAPGLDQVSISFQNGNYLKITN